MQIATGVYTGDGVNPRVINIGESWTPDLVLLKGGTNSALFQTSTLLADGKNALQTNGTNLATVTAFGAGTFTVNAATQVNANGVVYYWIAVFDDGAGDFWEGKYTGNNASGRTVTGLGFAPACVVTKRDANNAVGVFRVTAHAANASSLFSPTADLTTGILANDADGFTVGNSANVNANAALYYTFAFKEVAGQFAVGTYIGEFFSRRVVSGFRPSFATVKIATSAAPALFRLPDEADGNSLPYSATAENTNRILRFENDGFDIGTNGAVNAPDQVFTWFALGVGLVGGVARQIDGKLNEGTLAHKGLVN